MAEQEHRREREDAGYDWRSRNVRQMLQDVPKLREEAAGRAADPEKMRRLADDGDVDQPFDEATHHGCGDEARHPTHAHQSKTEEEKADQYGEGRGQRIKFRRSLRRYGANGHRGDQTSRSVRSHHQLPRRAEQRIGDQRWHDCIEAHDWRYADDAGVGHALRYHDGPECEAGKNIRQQPISPISWSPIQYRQKSVSY
jgi:hypothetical protein